MKNSKWKGLIFLLVVSLIACKNDDHEPTQSTGQVSFTIDVSTSTESAEEQNPVEALVSIENEQGNPVLSLEKLNLVTLGTGTVTEKIQLPVGQYTVTQFIVVNEANEAIYVAPLEGSDMAQYVEKPLPVAFQVSDSPEQSVPIEVLQVGPGSKPIDFGLIDFPIDFIDLLLVDLSLVKDGLPIDGSVNIEGYKNGSLLWAEQYMVAGSASVPLYNNVDTIVIEAFDGNLWVKKTYSIEQLQTDPQVVLDFSDTQGLEIEVVGLKREVAYAIGRLANEHQVHKVTFEIDQNQNRLVGNFQNITPGLYTMAISVYEGDNLITDPKARGSFYNGVESYETIEIVADQPHLIVQGPDIPSDRANHISEWSERYFYTFSDRNLLDTDVVWSTPELPCEFNLRILPEKLNPEPVYVYIDYFLHSENNGSTALGYEQCQDCDPFDHIESFFQKLSQDGSVGICERKDWDIADSMMILNFGHKTEEDLYFFMRWDTEGVNLFNTNDHSTGNASAAHDARSKGTYVSF